MHGVSGMRCGYDDVTGRQKPGTGPQRVKIGMIAADHAKISGWIEPLPAQTQRRPGKRAQGDIRLAGFQPGLEWPGIERDGIDAQAGTCLGHTPHQGGQKDNHADITDEDAECARRRCRIE